MIKYCLHPKTIRVRVAASPDEHPEDWDEIKFRKGKWAQKYFSAQDLMRYYNVKESECVKYDPKRHKEQMDLIQLKPDPTGIWQLPVKK